MGTWCIERGVMQQEGLQNVFYQHETIFSDEIIQYLFSWCYGKNVAKIKWLHLVTDPVLIMPALLVTPETGDGLYASIPGVHGLQLSSGQYKAVYDYEAQVSFLAQMSKFHIKQTFTFLIM